MLMHHHGMRDGPGRIESARYVLPAAFDTMALHRLPRSVLHRIAMRRFRAMVRHAAEHVAYYRESYRRAGVRASDLVDIHAIARIPSIDKSTLQNHAEQLMSDSAAPREQLYKRSSSGSTGRPSVTYFDPLREVRRRTQELRLLGSLGVRPWHRQIILDDIRNRAQRGTLVQKLGLWQREPFPFELPIGEALAHVENTRPEVIHGVLTPLRMFAYHVKATQGQLGYRPRFIISKGELLDSSTRDLIESVLRCRLHDYYATEEVGIVASEDAAGGVYNIDEDFVFVECIRPDGSPTDDGEPGELVLTNLYQKAMPIIRFRTGDLGVLDRSASGFGRPTLTSLRGRRIDCIVTLDGRILGPFVLITILEHTKKVLWFRIRQDAENRVTVNLALRPELSSEDAALCLAAVRARMMEQLGQAMQLHLVPELDPGALLPRKAAIVEGLRGLVDRKLKEGCTLVF